MNSNHKIISIFLFIALSLFLFSTTACAETVKVEAHWPAGVDSPVKTRNVSVTGPCLLIIRVTIDPFYSKVNWQYCWNNSRNTIPPFPYGKGISEGRAWENGVPVKWLKVKNGSRVFLEYRFKIRGGTHKGRLFVVPPQIRNLAGAFVNQYKQYYKVTIDTYPLNADVAWGPTGTKRPSVKGIVNGTKWSVGGHPVHWVFRANGTVEAPGLWKGKWSKSAGGYLVKITHKGVRDSFIVKFSSNGKSFIAYKNGKVYRRGVRVK